MCSVRSLQQVHSEHASVVHINDAIFGCCIHSVEAQILCAMATLVGVMHKIIFTVSFTVGVG